MSPSLTPQLPAADGSTVARWRMRIRRCAGPLAAAALLAGCAAPGMKMDAVAPGNAHPGGAESKSVERRADIYAITPEVVARLNADTRNAAERARATSLLPAQPSNGHRYLIGPQDVLRVIVWNHPEITNPTGTANELSGRVVNGDGMFFFPFVGQVQAAGRTVLQVRDALAQGLGGVLKNPQVDVAVIQYRSQRVFVSGEVRTPGAIPITDVPVNIVDAIAQAGGLGPEADLSNVTVTRGNTTFTLDLYGLYYGGDVSRNTRLQHGDIVNVPERRFNKVFVLGEVFRPASITMPRGRLTLAEALSDVGGVNPLTANSGQIYVIRGRASGDAAAARPQIFHLNASSADALVLADRFDLKSRDVVFVDPVKVVRWARVVNNILPTIDVLRETLNDVSPGLPR
ncbi:MAG: polysaccharide biosynthesis/export family protein [Burkholderiaceae bacterium]|nr:polysaccharide biosynthesis/export family protein [Burkholderiaceae bacterium]